MQKAICKETGLAGPVISAASCTKVGTAAGRFQSANTTVETGADFAAERAGSGAGSRLAGTATHSQPVGWVEQQLFSAAFAGTEQQLFALQQHELAETLGFGAQQLVAGVCPQSAHTQAACSGGSTANDNITKLRTSQWAVRQWRRKFISPFSQVSEKDQGGNSAPYPTLSVGVLKSPTLAALGTRPLESNRLINLGEDSCSVIFC